MQSDFVPALRFTALTPMYDRIVAWSTRDHVLKARLCAALSPAPAARVLDLGCGTGTLAIRIARTWPQTALSAVDADPDILAIARRKAARAGVSVEFEQVMAQSLPFAAATFDVAVSSLMFHHLTPEARLLALAELRRVLVPGGRLLIADFGRASNPLRRLAFHAVRLLDGYRNTRDHARAQLVAQIRSAGFPDVRIVDTLPVAVGSIDFIEARVP
jgi:ubiquinone/menaquinone biosynthesis C-methylase UbiE